jgi:hypothetical protein
MRRRANCRWKGSSRNAWMHPTPPGNRGLWLKTKCLNRKEFIVLGWTDPEGSRPFLGALLLAYFTPDGRLVYARRAADGISNAELGRLRQRLQPLDTPEMPLDVPPRRNSRFGSPLVLSRVHWVRPELVVEAKFLSGQKITRCARSSTGGCGRTSRQPTSAVLCRTRTPALDRHAWFNRSDSSKKNHSVSMVARSVFVDERGNQGGFLIPGLPRLSRGRRSGDGGSFLWRRFDVAH